MLLAITPVVPKYRDKLNSKSSNDFSAKLLRVPIYLLYAENLERIRGVYFLLGDCVYNIN